jgi:hypothetical protein
MRKLTWRGVPGEASKAPDADGRLPLACLLLACMAVWFVIGLGVYRLVAWWFAWPG